MVAPVSRGEIVLGKMLGGTTLAMIQGVLLLILSPFVGVDFGIGGILMALFMLFLVAFGLTGLGLLIAWTMSSSSGFHAIMNLLLMPMWLLSGAVFPFENAHSAIQVVMVVNPLAYGVVGFRQALYTHSGSPLGQPWPMWLCVVVTLGFALVTMFGSIKMANRKSDSGK
jgi:ABC-2 type transport system permease protein